jgi:hypothetical protein
MNLFERLFKNSTEEQLSFLYREYLPSNLLLITQKLIEQHTQGFAVDPKKYYEALKKSIK